MDITNENQHRHPLLRQDSDGKKTVLPGYPAYPESEDIYTQNKEEKEIDPEQISNMKLYERVLSNNEKDFEEDESGNDLDVPGSELDDKQEETGSEDEENNYYSLSDDNHDGLDEPLESII